MQIRVDFDCLMKEHVDFNFVITEWLAKWIDAITKYLKDHLGKTALREQIFGCTSGRADKFVLQSVKA